MTTQDLSSSIAAAARRLLDGLPGATEVRVAINVTREQCTGVYTICNSEAELETCFVEALGCESFEEQMQEVVSDVLAGKYRHIHETFGIARPGQSD